MQKMLWLRGYERVRNINKSFDNQYKEDGGAPVPKKHLADLKAWLAEDNVYRDNHDKNTIPPAWQQLGVTREAAAEAWERYAPKKRGQGKAKDVVGVSFDSLRTRCCCLSLYERVLKPLIPFLFVGPCTPHRSRRRALLRPPRCRPRPPRERHSLQPWAGSGWEPWEGRARRERREGWYGPDGDRIRRWERGGGVGRGKGRGQAAKLAEAEARGKRRGGGGKC